MRTDEVTANRKITADKISFLLRLHFQHQARIVPPDKITRSTQVDRQLSLRQKALADWNFACPDCSRLAISEYFQIDYALIWYKNQ